MIIPFERQDGNVISRDRPTENEQLARANKYANQSLEQIIGLNQYVSSGEFAKEVYEDYIPHLQKMFDDRRVITSNHAILLAFFLPTNESAVYSLIVGWDDIDDSNELKKVECIYVSTREPPQYEDIFKTPMDHSWDNQYGRLAYWHYLVCYYVTCSLL